MQPLQSGRALLQTLVQKISDWSKENQSQSPTTTKFVMQGACIQESALSAFPQAISALHRHQVIPGIIRLDDFHAQGFMYGEGNAGNKLQFLCLSATWTTWNAVTEVLPNHNIPLKPMSRTYMMDSQQNTNNRNRSCQK